MGVMMMVTYSSFRLPSLIGSRALGRRVDFTSLAPLSWSVSSGVASDPILETLSSASPKWSSLLVCLIAGGSKWLAAPAVSLDGSGLALSRTKLLAGVSLLALMLRWIFRSHGSCSLLSLASLSATPPSKVVPGKRPDGSVPEVLRYSFVSQPLPRSCLVAVMARYDEVTGTPVKEILIRVQHGNGTT